jgi:hypothetical protein
LNVSESLEARLQHFHNAGQEGGSERGHVLPRGFYRDEQHSIFGGYDDGGCVEEGRRERDADFSVFERCRRDGVKAGKQDFGKLGRLFGEIGGRGNDGGNRRRRKSGGGFDGRRREDDFDLGERGDACRQNLGEARQEGVGKGNGRGGRKAQGDEKGMVRGRQYGGWDIGEKERDFAGFRREGGKNAELGDKGIGDFRGHRVECGGGKGGRDRRRLRSEGDERRGGGGRKRRILIDFFRRNVWRPIDARPVLRSGFGGSRNGMDRGNGSGSSTFRRRGRGFERKGNRKRSGLERKGRCRGNRICRRIDFVDRVGDGNGAHDDLDMGKIVRKASLQGFGKMGKDGVGHGDAGRRRRAQGDDQGIVF